MKVKEQLRAPDSSQAPMDGSQKARLARVLALHESLGGTRDTFARVLDLHEEEISAIADTARVLESAAEYSKQSEGKVAGLVKLTARGLRLPATQK